MNAPETEGSRSGDGVLPPSAAPRGEAGPEPWGGEVRVRGGAAPSLLRWLTYALFLWAVLYLLAHPRLPRDQDLLWAAAALLAGWALFRLVTKRPPEL